MDFDRIIDRRGTHSAKWDAMEAMCGVAPGDGIAMWVADMDFQSPDCVIDAVRACADTGTFGYFGDDAAYLDAIRWWMQTRHGWSVERDWIFTTHGLVNGMALCLEAYSQPGEAVVLFTPVYHAFHRLIKAAGRGIVECELAREGDSYVPDPAAWDAQMTGAERIAVLCSPNNPNGRVWTEAELRAFGAFARRHDLILVCDEIHHDIVFPGARHQVMALADPAITGRLVMMTAASKTFNIAGMHCGNVIIPDPALRGRFAARMAGLGISPNSIGLHMTTAAYSKAGAEWVEALVTYLDGNRKLFDTAIAEIPGLRSVPLQATYLAWVDFAGTGMAMDEVNARVAQQARIAVNRGATFGKGGENFLRFNFGTQRARLIEACERLQAAFADLQ